MCDHMKKLLLLVILFSGCTSVVPSGLQVTLEANPSRMFSESFSTLHVDIDNHDSKILRDVSFSAFETGILDAYRLNNGEPGGACETSFAQIRPGEFKTFSCVLAAPPLQDSVTTEINTRVNFNSYLETTQLLEMMTEGEYQRRVSAGSFESKPRSYTYKDSNVMLEIDFNEQLPLIITPGKEYFVYFQVTNVGNGIVKDIEPGEFIVQSDILQCSQATKLMLNGREFPRVACRILLSPEYLQGKEFITSDIKASLAYNYELRNSLKIDVLK